MPEPKPYLKPADVAIKLGVNVSKVLGWIRDGELTAINTSDSDRPRWRITPEKLAEFERSRSNNSEFAERQPGNRHPSAVREYV